MLSPLPLRLYAFASDRAGTVRRVETRSNRSSMKKAVDDIGHPDHIGVDGEAVPTALLSC